MEFAAVQATNTVERTMKGEPPLPTEAFGSEGPAPLLESTGKPRSHDGCTIYENKHQAELDFFFSPPPKRLLYLIMDVKMTVVIITHSFISNRLCNNRAEGLLSSRC